MTILWMLGIMGDVDFRYIAMELGDCVSKSVSGLEQWKIFVRRLLAHSARSPQWEACWKRMKEAKDDKTWEELWAVCTSGLLSQAGEKVPAKDTSKFSER